MTRKELLSMIALHESLLKRAMDALNNRYEELERRNDAIDYLEEYLKQQRIIEWFKAQVPDD